MCLDLYDLIFFIRISSSSDCLTFCFTCPPKSPDADSSRIARLNRVAFKCWLSGITLSLISTISSLAKLRADGRRFALANSVARREYNEKTPEDRVREEEERREKGRALLAYVPLHLHTSRSTASCSAKVVTGVY